MSSDHPRPTSSTSSSYHLSSDLHATIPSSPPQDRGINEIPPPNPPPRSHAHGPPTFRDSYVHEGFDDHADDARSSISSTGRDPAAVYTKVNKQKTYVSQILTRPPPARPEDRTISATSTENEYLVPRPSQEDSKMHIIYSLSKSFKKKDFISSSTDTMNYVAMTEKLLGRLEELIQAHKDVRLQGIDSVFRESPFRKSHVKGPTTFSDTVPRRDGGMGSHTRIKPLTYSVAKTVLEREFGPDLFQAAKIHVRERLMADELGSRQGSKLRGWFWKSGKHHKRKRLRFFELDMTDGEIAYYARYDAELDRPINRKGVIRINSNTKVRRIGRVLEITNPDRVWKLEVNNELKSRAGGPVSSDLADRQLITWTMGIRTVTTAKVTIEEAIGVQGEADRRQWQGGFEGPGSERPVISTTSEQIFELATRAQENSAHDDVAIGSPGNLFGQSGDGKLSMADVRELLAPHEIDRDTILLDTQIGKGAFGNVFMAKWARANSFEGLEKKKVAVKSASPDVPDGLRLNMLREALIHSQIHHPHIVRLLGTCTAKMPFLIILEYMEFGSLQHYLRARRPDGVLPREMGTMLCQIASAMEYLEKQLIVHRDLAARNVLVDEDRSVKISDLGLSRDVYSSSLYEKDLSAAEMEPIRWMAPEAIMERRYSSKSDVYSFGVLGWEIYSYAILPWCEFTNSGAFAQIQKGNVLSRPEACPETIYDEVLLPCWNLLPDERPSFAVLYGLTKAFRLLHRSTKRSGPPDLEEVKESPQESGALPVPLRTGRNAADPPTTGAREYGNLWLCHTTEIPRKNEANHVDKDPSSDEVNPDVNPDVSSHYDQFSLDVLPHGRERTDSIVAAESLVLGTDDSEGSPNVHDEDRFYVNNFWAESRN